MLIVVYVRVSTATQAVEGVSIDAQRERAEQWAALNGATVAGVYADEGLSGSRSDNRPGLLQAIAEVERLRRAGEPVALVAYSLSRLARSTADTLALASRLERIGADLVSLSERIDTTSATGRMVFRLLAVLAEFERDQVAERTRLALRHKRSRGQKTGGARPFGFRVVRSDDDAPALEPEPAEQAVIARIADERRQGDSFHTIADRLNSERVPTVSGGRWTATTVRRIALRESAIG